MRLVLGCGAVGRDGIYGRVWDEAYVGEMDECRLDGNMCRLCSKAVCGVESAVAVFM